MLIALVLLAQSAGTLDFSDHAELRARVTQGATPSLGYDVVNQAGARMHVTDRRWELTLRYSANVTAPDVETAIDPLLLHVGDTAIAWHDRRLRLSLAESGTYGRQNAALLQTGATTPDGRPAPVQSLAAPTTIQFAATRTTGTAQIQFDRQWMARASGEYFLTGGLDDASRAITPLLRGPRAEALLSYRASHVDWVETRASALRSEATASPCGVTINAVNVTTLCAPEVETAQLIEVWRHAVSRHTEFSLGAGASGMRARLRPVAQYSSFLFPAALAAFDYRTGIEGERAYVHGDVQLTPMLDYVSALADYRLQATLQLRVPIRRTTLGAVVGAVRSVKSVELQPVTLLRAEATADFELEKWVSVGAGMRLAWQDQAPVGGFYTVVGFGYVTLRAPTMRF